MSINNWLRRNVGNISVLNHGGEPMDITLSNVQTRVTPVNSVNSQTESESKNGMME